MINEVFINDNISIRLTDDTVAFGVRYSDYDEYVYMNFPSKDLNKVIGLLEEVYEYYYNMNKIKKE